MINLLNLNSLICQILCSLEKLVDLFLVLGNSSKLINKLTLVDHESLGDVLDFQHLCNLWEFVNIHVHEVNFIAKIS